MDALKPVAAVSPNFLIKYMDTLSLIPNSPNDTGGIIDLTNITRLPIHK
jgi:hypothetical protein